MFYDFLDGVYVKDCAKAATYRCDETRCYTLTLAKHLDGSPPPVVKFPVFVTEKTYARSSLLKHVHPVPGRRPSDMRH